MVQLILDSDGVAFELPESQKDGYAAYKEPISVQKYMITGRMVYELVGEIWRVRYQYGYFNDADRKTVIDICRKGRNTPIKCGFLPPESTGTLLYKQFFVTALTEPTFMWSRLVSADGELRPTPMWANFSVELREVEPSD